MVGAASLKTVASFRSSHPESGGGGEEDRGQAFQEFNAMQNVTGGEQGIMGKQREEAPPVIPTFQSAANFKERLEEGGRFSSALIIY